MMSIHYKGARFQAPEAAVLMRVAKALAEAGLSDMAEPVRETVLDRGRGLTPDLTDPRRPTWRFTPWGDLALTGIIAAAIGYRHAPLLARIKVLQLLEQSGYLTSETLALFEVQS